MSTITDLHKHGQSIWLDYIDRDLVSNGGLAELVGRGIRGVTSNPTIFQRAITLGSEYDEAIKELLQAYHGIDEKGLYHWLTIHDIQAAADILRPIYQESDGSDGFVSLEVSPHLAHDTTATIAAAKHLWREIKRPNLMIKVPATSAGIAATEILIAEGINVNVTLLFSINRYMETVQAFIRGLQKNASPAHVHSVASFFISRIDTKVDALLDQIGTPSAEELKGKIAIANATMAYQKFTEVCQSDMFKRQANRGAKPQRLLWASTGVKNPDYSQLLYVEKLIGKNTVNTLPPPTLDNFLVHGEVYATLEHELAQAQASRQLKQLQNLGVDLNAICLELEKEGLQTFINSHDQLLDMLKEKCFEVARYYASVG